MTRAERKAANARRAVAYIRVSTDEQALGPEAQRAAIERWAAREGVQIVATFEDIGASGKMGHEEREGLHAAIGALKASKAGVLVVAKRDRLARSVTVAAGATLAVEKQGASVVSAAGEGAGDDPTAHLMRTMIDAFAEYERLLIGSRTKAALAVKKARGERIGGVPFGFRDVAGRLEEDAREQAIIAYAREQRAAGLTLAEVRDALTRRGYRPRSGRQWHATQVRRMLG